MKYVTSAALALVLAGAAHAAPVTYDVYQPLWGSRPMMTDPATWQAGREAAYAADPSQFDHVTGTVSVDWDLNQLLGYDLSYETLGFTVNMSAASQEAGDVAEYQSMGGTPYRERIYINATRGLGPVITQGDTVPQTGPQYLTAMIFSMTYVPSAEFVFINDIIIGETSELLEVDNLVYNPFLGQYADGTKGTYVGIDGTRREAENWALFGLDGSLTGGGTFTGVNIASEAPAVPLPAAGWMLLAGVGAMAGLRRKAKRA